MSSNEITTKPTLIQTLKAMCEEAEGRVPHMYLCSRGHVTAGVGHLIPTYHDAALLPFTPIDEAVHDWIRVKAAPVGMRAAAYAKYCKARLTDAAIDEMLDADIWTRVKQLRARYPFDGWPEPVQLAVFDMAYNLGLGRLEREYPRFQAALARRDWLVCAAECGRLGISEARNARTAAWFREAAES